MKYKSCARWPKGTIGCHSDISTDIHDEKDQALSVCRMLRIRGFGGDGIIFPIEVCVEEVV